MPTSIITRGSGVSIAGRRSRGLSPAFSRASAAYQSDGRKVGVGVPRFEMVDGRRGVLVEEGTTNFSPTLVANQDVAVTDAGDGWKRCTTNKTSSTPGVHTTPFDAAAYADKTITVSVEARHTGVSPRPSLYLRAHRADGSTSATLTLDSIYVSVEPTRLEFTTTLPADTSKLSGGILWVDPKMGDWFEYRHWQIEQKPYATSFVDGTRANEWLILPAAEMLQRDAGTIEGYVKLNDKIVNHPDKAALFAHANGTWPTNALYVGRLASGAFRVRFNTLLSDATSPIALVSGQWLHFAYRWDADAVSVFFDGQLLTDIPNTAPDITFGQQLHIGGYTNGTERANTCFSGLRLHRRALTDEEIEAHAAGNTVANDCYHYPFDGDLWPASGSLGAVVAPSIITRPASWR